MNILIIDGSPRAKGSISKLLDAAASALADKGAIIERLRVADKQINPCRGCMACRKRGRCDVFSDDINAIVEQMRHADAIVVGAPCYWGNMPGQMKMMFDRMVYALIGESDGLLPKPLMKGKRAAILTVCNTPSPWHRLGGQTSGTVKSIKRIFKLAGITTVATYQRGGVHRNQLTDSDLEHAKRKALKLL